MGFIRIIIAIFFAVSCQRSSSTSPMASPVVAIINEDAISLMEFRKALEEARPGGLEDTGEALKTFKKDLLDSLIERRLFIEEANRLKLSVEPHELQESIVQAQGDYSEEDFGQILQSRQIDFEKWKEKLREDLLVQKLISQMVDSQIMVTEEEIADYYKAHPNEFHQKETVRVRQIVVTTQEEAQQIQRLLTSGKDFGEIAKTRSLSPDRIQGGDLGFFAKGEMPEAFDVVFSLGVGKISPIIKSPYGYHLFKMEERRPGRAMTQKEATEKIHNLLIEEKRDGRFTEWVSDLRRKAKIQINYPLLYAPLSSALTESRIEECAS